MKKLTERQKTILLLLIDEELTYLELDVQGSLAILANDKYHAELVDLRQDLTD